MNKIEDWKNERVGNFTASNIHKLLVSSKTKDKTFGETAMTYIYEIVASMMTGESKPSISTKEIEWGNNYEAEAMDAYIEITGRKNVHYFGKENPVFFPLEGFFAGGSPDGLIENDRIIEIKCPFSSANHVENSIMTLELFKKERKDYYAQCQMNMIVTNTLYCDFCSYDPRVINEDHQLSILVIPYDRVFCDNLTKRIEMAEELRGEIYNRIIGKAA